MSRERDIKLRERLKNKMCMSLPGFRIKRCPTEIVLSVDRVLIFVIMQSLNKHALIVSVLCVHVDKYCVFMLTGFLKSIPAFLLAHHD